MRKPVVVLIVIVVLGGAGYYAYSSNWGPASWVKRTLGLSGDSRISANVRAAFALSKRLSPFSIAVQTQDGIATLSGQVSSEDVKSLAAEIARDAVGVKEVRNELVVDRAAQPSGQDVRVNDLEIKAAILEALAHSAELGGRSIDVRVENRSVILSGSVDTPAQRNGAEQVARAADSVISVTNELSVKNPQASSEPASSNASADPNADLAKRVKFELYETGAFDTLTINVQAQEGNVTLSGTVRTRAEQVLATFVAQGTPGARKVVNQLQIAPAARR